MPLCHLRTSNITIIRERRQRRMIYIYIRRKRSSGALKNSLTSAFIMDENDRWNDIEYSIQRTFSAMCVCV